MRGRSLMRKCRGWKLSHRYGTNRWRSQRCCVVTGFQNIVRRREVTSCQAPKLFANIVEYSVRTLCPNEMN
eukprot:42408-Amorphochlora_amoeboformis.AAC.1